MKEEPGRAAAQEEGDIFKLCGCNLHSSPYPIRQNEPKRMQPLRPSQAHGTAAIEHLHLQIAEFETVMVFGSEDHVTLENVGVPGKIPYFASQGFLTDINGRQLSGSQILAALPVDLAKLGDTVLWPPVQNTPGDMLPVLYPNTQDVGFAKNSFDFGDGSTIVSVGAAIAKTKPLDNGGALFWVVSCQVITQGTGKYEGARGIESFSGSSYFPRWPTVPQEQVQLLVSGFEARIHRCIKIVIN